MRLFIIAIIIISLASPAWAEGTAYEDTLTGKTCSESRQQISCKYKVGRDLEFSIDGIGMPDTSFTFYRTKGLQGDYYATYGLMHGCIVVKHGGDSELFGRDFAFVSPKNGKVYKTWTECKAGY